MGKTVIKLGDKAELIIDEPNVISTNDRAMVLITAIAQEFSGVTALNPSRHIGTLPVRIGATVYRVYYELKVKRVINALTAYSEAIAHIENNPHLYDARLSRKAIEVLRKCYSRELK